MDLITLIGYTVLFAAGLAAGYELRKHRKATVGLMVKFPQPTPDDDWKPEDMAGACIMFSEPVTFMGVQWFDRFGDVVYSEFLPFSDNLEEGA